MPSLWSFAHRGQAARNPITALRNLEDRLDLDGHVRRQSLQADRRAGVDTALAEDLVEQLREAVHHLWRLPEAGNAVDHPQHLDHARDPAQIAEDRLGLRQLLDRAEARGLVALLDGVGLADASTPRLTVPSGRRGSGEEE